MNRRALVVGGFGAAALAVTGAVLVGRRPAGSASGEAWRGEGDCGPRLTRADLDTAVHLGATYLAAAQLPTGAFVYEVDWRTGRRSDEDNVVRQTGAVWGLALANLDASLSGAAGVPAAREALDRALAFWLERHRRSGELAWIGDNGMFDKRRPRRGQTGAMALVGLGLVDRLRAPDGLTPEQRDQYTALLDGIVAWIRAARVPAGGFASGYDTETGVFSGNPNPYADGEALLLLCRVGAHLKRPELLDEAEKFAVEDHKRNVEVPLAGAPDPDTTKGYYQWGSMAWHELLDAGRTPDRYGPWLEDLAVWMIDIHHTLRRTRNTAYAYEGILSAYDWARRQGHAEVARKTACVAHQGLRKLFSWQLGHPLASADLQAAADAYRGGVQNEADQPALRIDVTQHQTHAAILARRYGVDEAEL